jgi:hypothetical protein
MKSFHPVISIILGVIVSFVLYLIVLSVFGVMGWVGGFQAIQGASWVGTFLLIISYIIGGFIATYFAKKKKIQYALYEGTVILLIFSTLTVPSLSLDTTNLQLLLIFSYGVLLLLLAVTGGMFGQMIKNEKFDGFSPVLSVMAGSIIGYSFIVLLTLLTGHDPDSYSLGVFEIAVGVASFLIGGLISIFLAKEKKIQIGIYTGFGILTIMILIGLVQMLIYHWLFFIHLIGFAVYVISAVIGAYIGIKIVKYQKRNTVLS